MQIEYEPRFLDEAVLRTVAARPEGRLFHRERERAYRIADPEERAHAFDVLNAAWAERLGLARPLMNALAEHPLVVTGVARCAVGRAPHPRDAGAELLVRRSGGSGPSGRDCAGPEDRVLRLLFAPEALLRPEGLLSFLRRELLHVADMLDPAFGYEPRLPPARGGPTYERLVRDRYRIVWNATVDGRLVRAGHLGASARGERWTEFAAAFPALGADAPPVFARFFDDPAPTHAAIVSFVAGSGTAPCSGVGACPLCGFPSADFDPDVGTLTLEAQAEIASDFPGWTVAAGSCRQCADLYRARPLSLENAAALPGIR